MRLVRSQAGFVNRYAGQKPTGTDLRTERPTGALMGVPFKFSKHGQSGVEVSELLPHTAKCIDDICVLRSLYTDNPNHGPALFMMTSGALTPSRPTLGAWLSYGLGTENDNLPALWCCAQGVQCVLQSSGPTGSCPVNTRERTSIIRSSTPRR